MPVDMAEEIASRPPGDGEVLTRTPTHAESRILRAARTGQVDEDFRPVGTETDDANRGEWGAERQLRADVLAELLLGSDQAQPTRLRRFRIRGARITGQLDD